ncbi:unnamed protein product [Eretmochelys imbricata]
MESRLGRDNIQLSKMHPFPCSALLTCFGSVRENTPFDQTDVNPLAAEVQKAETDSMICMQPSAKGAGSESHRGENTGEEMFQASSCSEKHSSTNSNSSNHVVAQPAPTPTDSSVFPDNDHIWTHDTITVQTHIPRPSIIGAPKGFLLYYIALILKWEFGTRGVEREEFGLWDARFTRGCCTV